MFIILWQFELHLVKVLEVLNAPQPTRLELIRSQLLHMINHSIYPRQSLIAFILIHISWSVGKQLMTNNSL
jgi:hypothetical protein